MKNAWGLLDEMFAPFWGGVMHEVEALDNRLLVSGERKSETEEKTKGTRHIVERYQGLSIFSCSLLAVIHS